jgi:hypothetical protein
MNTKHTFLTLCNKYDKIEVPIIQRDYAQGRETQEVIRLRKKFINDFLINALLNNQKIELDFVYGSILVEKKEEERKRIFIPLDGQQRLTTLYLLHFFIALKENNRNEIIESLRKFNYETRPSAHDFCKKLITNFNVQDIRNIKFEITNSEWYSESWHNDPTVSGMINMLDTFAKNELLINSKEDLLVRLMNTKDQLISFYFTDLDEFGLTENLYIRMNARGKMLTEFENFKSEFFKIINYNHELLEEVKDKIEYAWVNNFWQYRKEDSFVIDEPFMQFLSFITEMLYYKQAEFRSSKYESDFLDFKLLDKIYANENNLKFLIFSLDFIKQIKEYKNNNLLWKEKSSLHDILKEILTGKRDTNELYILFSALNYCYQNKSSIHLFDFLRVVRNLINNTKDNSRREWSRLLQSLNNLISNDNVYTLLINSNDTKDLIGFEVNQRKEEIFKANLFNLSPKAKESIFIMEDNVNFKGNISNLLLGIYANNEKDYENLSIENANVSIFNLVECNKIYDAYKEITNDNFKSIWGDLIITGLYLQTNYSRLDYNSNYSKHPAIIVFSKNYASNLLKSSLYEYSINTQKEFIKNIFKNQPNFEEIREVKTQLYLYYIIHKRIYNNNFDTFFKNGNYNFGWLAEGPSYKSLFTKGIDGCQNFPHSNPIFQVYNQQFRYNLGLNRNNTLDIEIIGKCNKKEPFKMLIEWANS